MSPVPSVRSGLFVLLLFCTIVQQAIAQYKTGTSKFEQKMKEGEEELMEHIQSHDDVKQFFYPEKLYDNIDIYRTQVPLSQDFTIGVMVSPCGDNSSSTPEDWLPFDCCVGRFGDGEYG